MTKKRVFGLMAATLACIALTTAAQAHEGTRGGGEAEYDDATGTFVLRDVVDPTVCVWETGSTVIEQNPMILKILASVGRLDWYFAFDLERRIRSQNYCFTQYLIPVDTRDRRRDRMTVEYSHYVDYVQAGIFAEDGIYIDRAIAAGMSAENRALLFIHEPMHMYLEWGIPRRNARLRSMVKTIQQIYVGNIRKAADLYAAITENRAQFPINVSELDGQKEYLMFALADAPQAREILLHTKDLSTLFGLKPLPSSDVLLADDFEKLLEVHSDPYGTIIAPYCEAQDREVLASLAGRPEVGPQNVSSVCLHASNATLDTPEFRAWILSMVDYESQVNSYYDSLIASPRVTAEEGRLMVTASVSDLTSTPADSRTVRPITELLALTDSTLGSLPSSAKGFEGSLSDLMSAGLVDRVIKLTAGNPKFYQAFSVTGDLARIATLPVGIERERPLATEVYQSVFQSYVHELLIQLGADANSPLTKAIDWNRLGYQF